MSGHDVDQLIVGGGFADLMLARARWASAMPAFSVGSRWDGPSGDESVDVLAPVVGPDTVT